MMVKSSVRLSVSENEDEEAVACFNAQCVGHQSLWGEGEMDTVLGSVEEGGGRMLAGGVSALPTNKNPPTTRLQY